MESVSKIIKTLEQEKKRLIIELYLREKFQEGYNPTWLNTMGNYTHLAAAIDFFYQLNNDNVNINVIGSDNVETRNTYVEQFKVLEALLDKLVVLTGDDPPITTSFNEKEATLAGLDLNQRLVARSLRDLHAQSSNLGVAEKLFNAELGQTEWLGEVDLERILIKLGVKDRTHISRLNAEDIGMILHFERVKHAGVTVPYNIPILINCGSSGSLRSQGSHWTYAIINVNPTLNSITINYQDSMPLRGAEQDILTNAINYEDGLYSAFPGFTTKTVNVVSDDLQEDNWSCGYRALKGLLTHQDFPVDGSVDQGVDWQTLVGTATESDELRDVIYKLLLSDLAIDEDYFVAMKLNKELLKTSAEGEAYELNDQFTKHYLRLLTHNNKTKEDVTTAHFAKEYTAITGALVGKEIKTDLKEDMQRLKKGIDDIKNSKILSSDAKILALMDILTHEYDLILKKTDGLAEFIKSFCSEQFGVELDKDQHYRLKADGLMLRMLNHRLDLKPIPIGEDSLLPPVKKTTVESSKSSSLIELVTTVKRGETSSVGETVDLGLAKLRKNKELTRIGSMFGTRQFCYAEKPSGVEPGFRAIDLDVLFFESLSTMLSDDKLSSDDKLPTEEKPKLAHLREALKKVDFYKKQIIFITFINAHVKGPHVDKLINPSVQWLCNQIKKAVTNNNRLNAWMYKLDYAEGQKNRVKANKEAIREFVGTRLAGIFSTQNQKQELVWINNGKNGTHALLACGWKNGLEELKNYLHGGSEPDYNGILVDNKNSPVKYSKRIPGLGKNLIFGIAIGDRDGMGKEAQNKGFAEGGFYGFDYGKPYEGKGVCSTLEDDCSFEDKYAKLPALFRGSSKIGFARHFMYRNYSVFYDTPLYERMEGVHLLRKMITGGNPSEEVIKSYPGLRQELYRIQEHTPSPKELLKQLNNIRSNCKAGGQLQALVDTYIMQISTGKLSPFNFYFAKIKLDLIEDAIKNDMSYEEIEQYMIFIDEMALIADNSNQDILKVFEQRALLTKQEIDLIDKLEKFFSPTSVMHHDGTVFLNTMRFDPLSGRIPFQLIKEENGTYTLSTKNTSITGQLREDFGLKLIQGSNGLVCNITPEDVTKLMRNADIKYNQKREKLLIKPTFFHVILPHLISLINEDSPELRKIDFGYTWHTDNSLSLRIIVKTEQQALQVERFFGTRPIINETQIVEISSDLHREFQEDIAKAYESRQRLKHSKVSVDIEKSYDAVSSLLSVSIPKISHKTDKWDKLHKKSEREVSEKIALLVKPAETLLHRLKALMGDEELFTDLKNAIQDITDPCSIEKLTAYNDKTLALPENIQAIINDRLEDFILVKDNLDALTDVPRGCR